MSFHVQRFLRLRFNDLLVSDRGYLTNFHLFEYLLALQVADLTDGQRWWHTWLSHDPHIAQSPADTLQQELDNQGADSPLVRAGFCGGSLERIQEIKATLDAKLTTMQWQ
jgi:hypothetical protein